MSLWYFDTSHSALIYFDPEMDGRGMGFSVPAIDKVRYWKPTNLEVPLRLALPRLPSQPSPIQVAQNLPPHARRH